MAFYPLIGRFDAIRSTLIPVDFSRERCRPETGWGVLKKGGGALGGSPGLNEGGGREGSGRGSELAREKIHQG